MGVLQWGTAFNKRRTFLFWVLPACLASAQSPYIRKTAIATRARPKTDCPTINARRVAVTCPNRSQYEARPCDSPYVESVYYGLCRRSGCRWLISGTENSDETGALFALQGYSKFPHAPCYAMLVKDSAVISMESNAFQSTNHISDIVFRNLTGLSLYADKEVNYGGDWGQNLKCHHNQRLLHAKRKGLSQIHEMGWGMRVERGMQQKRQHKVLRTFRLG